MNIYTVEEMRARDLNTLHSRKIDVLDLVEEAAKAIFDTILRGICFSPEGKQFFILCGKGNNGADGLALAKLLKEAGARTLVAWVWPLEACSREVKKLAGDLGDGMYLDDAPEELVDGWLEESHFIVDAVLGTGCSSPVEEELAGLFARINESRVPVISLDIPSGIHANNGLVMGAAVQADHTVVVDSLKAGNLLGESCDHVGELLVTEELSLWTDPAPEKVRILVEEKDQVLSPRSRAGHKYEFGKLSVVGGTRGMEGAPVMAALAGLKTGCGLSSVLTFENWEAAMPRNNHQLMIDSFSDEEELMKKLDKTTSVVFGPGTLYRERDAALLAAVIRSNKPVVLDGGAIQALNGLRDRIQLSSYRVIATPHHGELARLFRVTSKEIVQDSLYFAQSFLETYGVDLILKGPCTLIGSQGEIGFAYRPNPGMATAGSGDVLSGLVGGFLAQGQSNKDAMRNGVLVHQIAGDQARKYYGERSMTAMEILENIHEGVRALEHSIREEAIR